VLEKSIEFLFIRAGVPVLNLLRLKPKFLRDLDKPLAGNSPEGPLFWENSPINIFDFKYTPVATITQWQVYISPVDKRTPEVLPPSTNISTTSPCFNDRFSWRSKVCFIEL